MSAFLSRQIKIIIILLKINTKKLKFLKTEKKGRGWWLRATIPASPRGEGGAALLDAQKASLHGYLLRLFIDNLRSHLKPEFAINDLGPLHYFGISFVLKLYLRTMVYFSHKSSMFSSYFNGTICTMPNEFLPQ